MKRWKPIAVGVFAAGAAWSAGAQAQVQFEISQGFPWQGLSLFTIVMALIYAGHLAQGRTGLGWRILLFILGFPLTFVVSFLVAPGSQRVLGVDLPRHDLKATGNRGEDGGPARQHDGEGADRAKRRAEWEGIIALMIGISIVFLFAPDIEYRSEPIDGGRYAVEKRSQWGWGDDPWVVVRSEGVRDAADATESIEPEWTSREWQFDASLEGALMLAVLLALFALCVADELRRGRSSGADGADPTG